MAHALTLCALLLAGMTAQAQRTEGELIVGPMITSVQTPTETTTYVGMGLGASIVWRLHTTDVGSVRMLLQPLVVVGKRPDGSAFDVQRAQLPLIFCIGFDDMRPNGTPGLGGSVLVGAALAFGTFNRNATDLRPFVGFDLTMGLLEDSAIKLRYATVLGDFQPRRGEFVSYHGVYVVGTTRW